MAASNKPLYYYSKTCVNCKQQLQQLARDGLSNLDVHFLCVDNRESVNGQSYLVLDGGQRIILPPMINQVPALLLLSPTQRVLFGKDILAYFSTTFKTPQVKQATQHHMEPQPAVGGASSEFSDFGGFMGSSGVYSDRFVYLDGTSSSNSDVYASACWGDSAPMQQPPSSISRTTLPQAQPSQQRELPPGLISQNVSAKKTSEEQIAAQMNAFKDEREQQNLHFKQSFAPL